MRLTLRTLLAYLDDILEEDDIQVLKAKIEESPRATQLIERIRTSVDNGSIGALSPDAIGPLENANAMGEYLDSTLSPEQIAELERLCMDSDMSLAEATACHQILTVVLGQPAQVPDLLRQRIYDLPLSDALQKMEQQTQPAADARAATMPSAHEPRGTRESGRDNEMQGPDEIQFASSAGPLDANLGGGMDRNLASAATQIRPVGPDDSGVSQAAVRMRSDGDELDGRSEAEIVAMTTRAMQENSGTYGGSIRPSRIAPWLVTLAMTAVVAYVLMQIFSPLTKRRVSEVDVVAMQDIDKGGSPISEPSETSPSPPTPPPRAAADASIPTNESVPVAEPKPPTNSESSNADSPTGSSAAPALPTQPEPMIPAVPAPPLPPAPVPLAPLPFGIDQPEVAQPEMNETPKPIETVVEVAPEPSGDAASPNPNNMAALGPQPAADTTANETKTSPPEPTSPAEEVMNEKVVNTVDAENTTNRPGDSIDAAMADPPTLSELPAADSDVTVAQLNNKESLILAATAQGWARLVSPGTDAKPSPLLVDSVRSGQTIIAPALYRPILTNQEGLEWTLAGPTRLKITRDSSDATITDVIDGRLLLASTEPGVSTMLQLGPRTVQIVFPDAQTVLAIEMVHFRPAGIDPLVPENRRPIYRVIVVQGEATLNSEIPSAAGGPGTEDAVTLPTGQQWRVRGDQDATVTPVNLLPTWIDDAAQKNLAFASAREGLMDFVTKVEPVEKTLREAMAFRRVEVAALAAETLLLLGRADVYFGSDGILSRPRQRLFWTEHFQMLRQHIASSAQAAADVKSAIKLAELADSDNLFKLLVGFTNDELAAGGDEKLVKLLDSASMPVRVLAIENLKAIVGDDLGYRADQENANTRRADIKKWEARLRKGDIRYAN